MNKKLIKDIENEADKIATEVAYYASSGKFSNEIYEISMESFIYGAEFICQRNNKLRNRIVDAKNNLGYSVFEELLSILDGEDK